MQSCLFPPLCIGKSMFRTHSNILSKQSTICRSSHWKNLPWPVKAPCKLDNFDQKISLDADGDETYRLTPHPIKAQNPVRIFTSDEVVTRFTHADYTAQQLGIYSHHDWTKSMDNMNIY